MRNQESSRLLVPFGVPTGGGIVKDSSSVHGCRLASLLLRHTCTWTRPWWEVTFSSPGEQGGKKELLLQWSSDPSHTHRETFAGVCSSALEPCLIKRNLDEFVVKVWNSSMLFEFKIIIFGIHQGHRCIHFLEALSFVLLACSYFFYIFVLLFFSSFFYFSVAAFSQR